MARYIDADKVMEEIASMSSHNLCEWSTLGVKALINRQPTADVAPRAEVAREIFWEIEKTVNDCVVDKSLFKPAYFEFRKFNEHLAALKKKYTEEQ